jgi:hypothetical protein
VLFTRVSPSARGRTAHRAGHTFTAVAQSATILKPINGQ